MKKLLIIIFFLSIPVLLSAQGFNSINGRNHPELKWQVAETEHFRIMFPEHLGGIENKAASISEASYEVLSKNLEVTFNEKIRIYLSDEDEITNGFAVPIGTGYTDIWVHVNEYADTFTGEVKWLRKVIAHELGHIFHFKAVKSNIGFLQFVFGDPLPSFWTEGLAQYETEKWDSQRGDRWLRLAVFDDKMNYYENNSSLNNRLRYAVGNSQLRYFTETYGDTTLAKMLKHRDSMLGLKYHDFKAAFAETISQSYESFNDEWRKHINIYYNTLASGMNRTDSLGVEPTPFPGQFLYDIKYSPDQEYYAVLSMTSLERPVRRLYLTQNDSTSKTKILAEGLIAEGINWSSDGNRIVYSRRTREEHGSIISDLFLFDLDLHKERQLTRNRRAWYPVFSSVGEKIAFVASESGTSNIYLVDLKTGEEEKLTSYQSDTELIDLTWNHQRNELVFHRFDSKGNRNLVVLDIKTGREQILDNDVTDNRKPVISPDGRRIAFTSLRDEVPNIFIYDFETDTTQRFTRQFTGAEAYQWLSKTENDSTERLILKATEDKDRDYLYSVDLSYRHGIDTVSAPSDYASWREKSPPNKIPYFTEADASPVQNRYPYNSFRNITHVASFAIPYYAGSDDYGIGGFTSWIEPLGKHIIAGGGWLSIVDPGRNSYGLLTYVNNQLYPTIAFSGYKLPGDGRFYGSNYLIEELTGGEVRATWPIDRFDEPYRSDRFSMRLRHVLVRPLESISFPGNDIVPQSEKARQTDLQLSWITKKQRPYKNNTLHPIDGYGLRLMLTGSEKILGSETAFLIPDISAYKILPGFGLQRLYLYGRFQVQFGDPLPQDFIGLSRYSNIDLPLPDSYLTVPYSKAERVRGYKSFAAGKQVIFGSLEYRMPFSPSLQTSILGGFLQLGQTSLTLFADGGIVWDVQIPADNSMEKRLGTGIELKNQVGIGPLKFVHSLGIAQPYDALFGDEVYDLYYQIKASVPF